MRRANYLQYQQAGSAWKWLAWHRAALCVEIERPVCSEMLSWKRLRELAGREILAGSVEEVSPFLSGIVQSRAHQPARQRLW